MLLKGRAAISAVPPVDVSDQNQTGGRNVCEQVVFFFSVSF